MFDITVENIFNLLWVSCLTGALEGIIIILFITWYDKWIFKHNMKRWSKK